MTYAFPALSIRAQRVTASPRKLLALAIGHLLTGAALFCAAYAANLIMTIGGVDCASVGMLLLAFYGSVLGVSALRSAEANLD